MEGSQQDHGNVSMILSEVLSDIGVNDEMIKKRRTGTLFEESMYGVWSEMTNNDVRMYLFGSQSEGTTTLGINSDADALMNDSGYHINQDLDDWKPNITNLLMVQDETTAPGYCLLQLLQKNARLQESFIPDNDYVMDGKGRILLKNTIFHNSFDDVCNVVHHGPAANIPGSKHMQELDAVPAFHCDRWPRQARRWLHRRSVSGWPTRQLQTEAERSGCFLVAVGSKTNDLDELEWRISTSHAERCLIFSLNITHLRCFVLMKMLKSHINCGCDNVISSYMCKTAVLHCVENTDTVLWQGHNLLVCLNKILRELYNYVRNINCPHIIIPENNLMAGRISAEQQHRLIDNIQHILDSNDRICFEIQTDDIGARLQTKLNIIREFPENLPSAVSISRRVSDKIMIRKARVNIFIHMGYMREINDEDNIAVVIQHFFGMCKRLNEKYAVSSHLEQEACCFMLPLLSSAIGYVFAAFGIMLKRPLSDFTHLLCMVGVDSDVSSGWLKLATVYYSSGENNATETILRHVDKLYDRNIVLPICGCHIDQTPVDVPGIDTIPDQIQNDAIGRYVSYCVSFMRCEVNIVPHEMQLEFSRSTQEDIQCRNFPGKKWMDFAVVDSLPYLYFLQYKTYGRLNNRREQESALHKLQHVIRYERNLSHKETALNLLGQCKEQENLPNEAFNCYERSLLERPRRNAARIHRARVLIWLFVKFHDCISKDTWINFMN